MKSVLIRVTGRRRADSEAVFAPLIGSARRYVQQYRGAADGQLWVAFDGPAIERWLAQNGQPLWGRERPVTFVWLTVQNGAQGGSVVSRDDSSDLKTAIDAEAQVRGIPLRWPSSGELQSNHMDYAAVNAATPAALADLGRRYGGEGVLIGHAAGAGATVRWTLIFQDHSGDYAGTVEGVDRAADAYAAVYAAAGGPVPLEIEVSGITDLHAYASVANYLQSLTFVSRVSVEQLGGDVVKFRLSARGGAESLQHALAMTGPLEPLPGGGVIQRFKYRR
jgi:hypothetical protein